jgi:hypothetical protein
MNARTAELQIILNEEQEKNLTLNTTIRRLQINQQNLDSCQDEIFQLRDEKKKLERQLNELARQPIFQNFKNNAESAVTIKNLEAEIQTTKLNNESLTEKNKKLQTELEIKISKIKMQEEEILKQRERITEMKIQIE